MNFAAVVYLSEAHFIRLYSILIHTWQGGGGSLTREKLRGVTCQHD
jgi:hypothetical protein